MSHLNHVVVGAALAAACVVASGQASASPIVFTSQSRSITATVEDHLNSYTESHTEVATDFGVFNRGVGASVPGGPGLASASQNSTLNADTGINATLYVSAIGSVNYQQTGYGSSSFFVAFDVLEPTTAMVTFGSFAADFSLSGPDLHIGMGLDSFGPEAVLLMPGQYRLNANASFFNGSSSGSGAYVVASVVIPSAGSLALLVLGAGMCVGRRRG